MKFKVGDEVQIKSRKWFETRSSKYHYIGVGTSMIELCEKIRKVEFVSTAGEQGSSVARDQIIYNINGWWFHGDMLTNARFIKIKKLNKISNESK